MSDPKPAFPPLPPAVVAVLTNVKAVYSALPRAARMLLMVTAGLAIVFSALIAYQKANEAYAPLFSQLDREDAAAILAKLKELKVPYRVEGDGTTIAVPESRSQELRLELASGGLPRGGGVGFESFDKMRLGATDFEQRVLYRRALEGELTRTIGTLGAVESARVHLVLPEKSVFVTRNEPASASIVLRLRTGRTLGATEVAGMVHLVASAVPSLQPDHVSVVTTQGVTLHRPRKGGGNGEEDGLDSDEDARAIARSYESSIEDRVRSMLERVVGVGRADVRVTADIDSAHVERLEEHFDPSKTALRSEESSTERSAGEPDDTVAGIPGAESNLPGGASKGSKTAAAGVPLPDGGVSAPVAAALPAGSLRESHTRNFEVDKVSEKRVSGGPSLRRLAVAVVLDGKGAPMPQVEIDKLAALVKSAAGASDLRGDVVTVESMAFADALESTADARPAPVAPLTRMQMVKRYGPYAGAALVAMIVLVIAGAAMRRRRPAPTPVVAELSTTPAVPSLEAPLRPVLDAADLRTRAHSRASQDPATAALVLRFWLGTSSGEPTEPAKA